MGIIVNKTDVENLKVKTPSATKTILFAMARGVRETSLREYNWKYVHGAGRRELLEGDHLATNHLNTFTITVPWQRAFTPSGDWSFHIVIGYSAGNCSTSLADSRWVDIIARGDGKKMVIDEYGPNADPNLTVSLGALENGNTVLPLTVYYPVVWTDANGRAVYKFHGVGRRQLT